MQVGWKVADGCEPEKGQVRFVRTVGTSKDELLPARIQATQMLFLLAIPRVARRPLVNRLMEVTTELAEGHGPQSRWYKRVQNEARALADILTNVDHFESLVENRRDDA